MELVHIEHGGGLYQQAKQLRLAVLRLPLRRVLTAADLEGEEKQLHFVALENGLVIGTVTMKPLSKTEVKLRQMAISPTHQGKGIGKQLVAYAEEPFRKLGFTRVTISARETAKAFYERIGYSVDGEPFTEVGLPHLPMVKEL
jgi:predicted N-acetyltransferase YhbS